ncbi:MAG: hypothetical protein MUE50_24985, partial [Pirellulaceae bacterium]|nr:hypothetical protein [Pirellulaceae bacterium]
MTQQKKGPASNLPENAASQAEPAAAPSPTAAPALSNDDAAVVARLRDAYRKVKAQVAKVVVGQQEIVEHLLIGLLCRGHVLLLGVPG